MPLGCLLVGIGIPRIAIDFKVIQPHPLRLALCLCEAQSAEAISKMGLPRLRLAMT